tara:strand:- start:583 stop:1467 length:885 start_codon:yes stop_codon:yes gene_type:complete
MHTIDAVDPTNFDPLRMAPIRHEYHEHPLLQLDELSALARRLMPRGNCRFVKEGMRAGSAFDHFPTPPDGKSLDEFLATIEQPGSWMALYDAQVDETYRQLLGEVSQHIQRLVAPSQTVYDVRSFLFLSAPPSVTPYHIDRENNFWLQIRGRKVLTLWDYRDHEVLAPDDREKFILYGDLDNVRFGEQTVARGRRFECGPGDGVYFPSTTPHMTETRAEWNDGDALSISVGMVFYTNVTTRHARAMKFNRAMRIFGLEPLDPHDSLIKESIKGVLGCGLWPLRRLERLRRPGAS